MTHDDYQTAGAWRVYHAHGYAEILPARSGAVYSATGRAVTRWADVEAQVAKQALIAKAQTESHILGTR